MKTPPRFPTQNAIDCPRCNRAHARIARAGLTPMTDHSLEISGFCFAQSTERKDGLPRKTAKEFTT